MGNVINIFDKIYVVECVELDMSRGQSLDKYYKYFLDFNTAVTYIKSQVKVYTDSNYGRYNDVLIRLSERVGLSRR